jgi:CBS domain-containing protein
MPTVTDTSSHRHALTGSLEHAVVADAMHPGIVSCEPDTTLSEAARIMTAHRVHCLAVIGISHRQPECGVWSIISDLDLLRASVRGATDSTARAMATGPLVTVEATMPLRDAGELMLAAGVSHAVVIDPERERPIGVLSTLDIAGVLASGAA